MFAILDLETTGLSPTKNSIIEVAITKTDGNSIIDNWSSFVFPLDELTPEITHITGIHFDMIQDAPSISEILPKIQDILADCIIVGHNIDFDKRFLEAQGMHFPRTIFLDTCRLAQLIFPENHSYALTALTADLGISHKDSHRALSDTQATAELFHILLEKFQSLPPLKQALCAYLFEQTVELDFLQQVFHHLKISPKFSKDSLQSQCSLSLENHFQKTYLEQEGILDDSFDVSILFDSPGLESRPNQKKLFRSFQEAFVKKTHLAVEAPTGIGKTYAYMLAGIDAILHGKKQIIFSTHTKTLQDQLVQRDIPTLLEKLSSLGLKRKFSVAKLKGKQNYASTCHVFTEFFSDQHPEGHAFLLLRLMFLLLDGKFEIDSLSFLGEERSFIYQYNSSDRYLLSPENPYRDIEPYYHARLHAKRSEICVLNHSLCLSLFPNETEGIFDQVDALVFDEAHKLEDAATEATHKYISYDVLFRSLERISFLLSHLDPKLNYRVPEGRIQLQESLLYQTSQLFEYFGRCFYQEKTQNSQGYGQGHTESYLYEHEKLQESLLYAEVLVIFSELLRTFDTYLSLFQDLHKEVQKLLSLQIETLGEWRENIAIYFQVGEKKKIRMIDKKQDGQIQLHYCDLAVAEFLQSNIYSKVSTCIATSATLTIGNTFQYLSRILGWDLFQFETLPTDFNYIEQMKVCIPNTIGDTRTLQGSKKALELLRDALILFGGKSLVLFTSYAQIKEATNNLSPALRAKGIQLLAQGVGGGKQKILEQFRRDAKHSVLFGTESFWEGIDIPGDDLGFLVITKMPFTVPSDPIFLARSREFKNPFEEYAVPAMLLRLRQGIGRLIRTQSDRGILLILDTRVLLMPWGRSLQSILPDRMQIFVESREKIINLITKFVI